MVLKIKAIVFDIGGVLVENPKYKSFWGKTKGSDRLRVLFGMGKISEKDFIQEGSRLMNITQKEFIKKYKEHYWTGNLNISAFKIYKSIRINKYLFSDTNPIHQKYLKNNFKEIFHMADGAFLNKRKDYIKSYKQMLKSIKLKPRDVVLIDDKETEVEKARRLGINAILFENGDKLRTDLKTLGIDL